MQIFAAIDLKDGKCVRLMQGDPNVETIYGEDPVAIAETWETIGTDWLHIINLDGVRCYTHIGARQGLQAHLEEAIAQHCNIEL